jgi:hypothetical protein
MGAYLSRACILAATSLPAEDVHVPEWADPETGDDLVRVRALDGAGRDEFEASTTVLRGSVAVRDTRNIRAKLVIRCAVDPGTGEPLFAPEDVDALGRLSGVALNRVWAVACRLSGMTEDDADLEGKSPDPPGGGSPSS